MTRFRLLVIVVFFCAPWVFLIGAGGYFLWVQGWMVWAWVPMFASLALAYYLGWRWTRRGQWPYPGTEVPPYWTARDQQAWQKVIEKAQAFEQIRVEQLENPQHYSEVALDLAKTLAEVYHPGLAQPFDRVTLPEILTCIELAAADLNERVQKYVPGSHLWRLGDLQHARRAVDYYKTGQNLYWAGAALVDPVQTALRFIAARSILGGLMDRLQNNIILWFHTAFIQQLGWYLIELYSGRLRVGVKRYRELLAAQAIPSAPENPQESKATPASTTAVASGPPLALTLAVLGAVKAGKSSLVNALLGRSVAAVDRRPVAAGHRYNTMLPGGPALSLWDTSGYGQDGPDDAAFTAATTAAQEADLIILVTSATNPGRQADVALLERLGQWFADKPHLKMPPVIVAVTHIDLLSPKSEWQPPYDWRSGTRPKEQTIRACVEVVREQLGARVTTIVPMCTREGEQYGISEELIPAIVSQLDQARGTAILKAFATEATAGQYQKIAAQLREGGKQFLNILGEAIRRK
ncbi:MAG: GTPase [Gemmataceae bacterium]|nr:50S ribosome-binding GTPase [Gemmata sp.]MDW8199351.1 GTPase [Gemmataceae bacterium]